MIQSRWKDYFNEQTSDTLELLKSFNRELALYEYIVVMKNKTIIDEVKKVSFNKYQSLSPQEFVKYHGGICWDYVAYQYYYFKKNFNNIKVRSFFFAKLDKHKIISTHTFNLLYFDNKVYWFEASWKTHIGIFEGDDEDEILSYVINILLDGKFDWNWHLAEFVPSDELIGISDKEYIDYMSKLPVYNFQVYKKPNYKIIQSIFVKSEGKDDVYIEIS